MIESTHPQSQLKQTEYFTKDRYDFIRGGDVLSPYDHSGIELKFPYLNTGEALRIYANTFRVEPGQHKSPARNSGLPQSQFEHYLPGIYAGGLKLVSGQFGINPNNIVPYAAGSQFEGFRSLRPYQKEAYDLLRATHVIYAEQEVLEEVRKAQERKEDISTDLLRRIPAAISFAYSFWSSSKGTGLSVLPSLFVLENPEADPVLIERVHTWAKCLLSGNLPKDSVSEQVS